MKRMVISVATTYSICGCLISTSLGILFQYKIYITMMASKYKMPWISPIYKLLVILINIIITGLSVIRPKRKLIIQYSRQSKCSVIVK